MRPPDLTPLARDVLKGPASLGLLFFSLVAAYLLTVLPWSGAWLLARPDFVLVVLLFWPIRVPRFGVRLAAFRDRPRAAHDRAGHGVRAGPADGRERLDAARPARVRLRD